MEDLSNLTMSNVLNSENKKGLKLGASNFVSNPDSKEQAKEFYLMHLAPSSFQILNNEEYQAVEEMDTLDEDAEVDPNLNDGDYDADPDWYEDGEEDPNWDEDDEIPFPWDENGEADPNEPEQDDDDLKETNKVECEVAPGSDDLEDE